MPPVEQLWAPWRMTYIESSGEASADTSAVCIFCACAADDRPELRREHGVLVVARHAFVILNRYPYNNGHVMVVPRRHVGDPADLTAEEYVGATELVRRTT